MGFDFSLVNINLCKVDHCEDGISSHVNARHITDELTFVNSKSVLSVMFIPS